jgi:Saccharopine dehydrogenase NADP binding domain
MKVLILGGTGVFGKSSAALLAKEKQIIDIGLASRHLDSAKQAASEIGEKTHAVCVDISDLSRLSSIAADYDLIINAAGPTSKVQIPALQAAVQAGVHYCDLGVIGETARQALLLDSQARASNITAVICSGWFAIMSMMAVHATHQFDETEELSICALFDFSADSYYSLEKSLARAHELGHVETSWDFIETARTPVLTYRSGGWINLEPYENPIEVFHPSGRKILTYPSDFPVALAQPDLIPGVKTVANLFSVTPPPLNELLFQQGQRIAKGETDMEGAVMAFFEIALADTQRWLSSPPGYPSGYWMWDIAIGYKNGRKARYMCWPSFILEWTTTTLNIIALRILRGEIDKYGILLPEACFELESFFQEAAKYVSEEHRGEPLLNERFDWLE